MHPEVREWLYEIRKADRVTAILTMQAIRQVLEGAGPEERRPLVERLKGSRVRHLRELRPAGGGAGHLEARLLFAFDRAPRPGQPASRPHRMVLLVAGESTGSAGNWSRWHREAVPLAEARFQDYLAATRSEPAAPTTGTENEHG